MSIFKTPTLVLELSYVKGDLKAMLNVLAKVEKPTTAPNQDQEVALVIRQAERCRKALSQMERALAVPKPARAASAKGGEVKGTK